MYSKHPYIYTMSICIIVYLVCLIIQQVNSIEVLKQFAIGFGAMTGLIGLIEFVGKNK